MQAAIAHKTASPCTPAMPLRAAASPATPAKPSASPSTREAESRSLSHAQAMAAANKGVAALRMAVNPAVRCSAA